MGMYGSAGFFGVTATNDMGSCADMSTLTMTANDATLCPTQSVNECSYVNPSKF